MAGTPVALVGFLSQDPVTMGKAQLHFTGFRVALHCVHIIPCISSILVDSPEDLIRRTVCFSASLHPGFAADTFDIEDAALVQANDPRHLLLDRPPKQHRALDH